jgi:hypothetical protein
MDNYTDGWMSTTKLQLTPGGEPQKHIMISDRPFGYKHKTDQ